MTSHQLTGSVPAARTGVMQGKQQTTPWSGWHAVRAGLMGSALALSGTLAGCISVTAPDKPIVIELNINIKQEVIYRLAADAANTIENNPAIF
jgi:hypothetical protein